MKARLLKKIRKHWILKPTINGCYQLYYHKHKIEHAIYHDKQYLIIAIGYFIVFSTKPYDWADWQEKLKNYKSYRKQFMK